METREDDATNRAPVVIAVLSLLVALPLLLAIFGVVGAIFPRAAGTLLERAVTWALFYLVAPIGLLDAIVGTIVLRKKPAIRAAKGAAIFAITIGLLGVFTGILLWLFISGALGQVY